MKAFRSSIVIHASADTVWRVLTDASGWLRWNPTVVSIEGRIAAGQKVTVTPKANPGRAFPLTVSVFDAPRQMVWTGGMPLGLFKGERTFTLTPRDGAVEFTMREEFTGPLAGLIGKSIPDLQPSFDEFAAALKQAAEAQF